MVWLRSLESILSIKMRFCYWYSILFAVLTCGKLLEGSKSTEGKQTWGYVEVRPGANIFWWLYYTTATEEYTKKPLVLWLQGGPGASSTGFGNFQEIGPLDVELKNRSDNWVSYTNVLFVDNPVGSGFSYVNDTKLLATDNSQIAMDLVEFMTAFLQKVPEFQNVPLYIFSESYGGKMTAQFAVRLNKAIAKGKLKCNLKGIALGDSWISPIDSVLTWAPYLFSTSLVDNAGFTTVNSSAYSVKSALDKGDYKRATLLWDLTENLISKATNGVNVYNILKQADSSGAVSLFLTECSHKSSNLARKHLAAFHSDPLSTLMNGKIKEMLRIIPKNVTWGGQSSKVFDALSEDFMKPVTLNVESLLNNTPIAVNVYSGQLDMIVDTMGTTQWVEQMSWAGIPGWKGAKRHPIMLKGSTEGFVKSFKNLNFYWILKAGHMVPADSPATGVELLQLITNLKQLPI